VKDKLIYLLIGIIVGWITVPTVRADNLDNTYKGLIRQMIQIISRIEISSAQIADNTRAIKEKLGAK